MVSTADNMTLGTPLKIQSLFPWLLLLTAILIPALQPAPALSAVGKNKLTIVNQSGEDTAIKLLGPREWLIEIPAGQERTILLPSGDYTYITRYGQDPDFRYSRGTPFQIEQSRIGFTEASLTLISAPSSTYVDPNLVEIFNRQVAVPLPAAGPKPPMDSQTAPPDKTPASGGAQPKGDFILHRVTSGETLPTISQYYSGEADYWPEIAKFNPTLDPMRLREGIVVKVPIYLAIVQKAPPSNKPVPAASKKPSKTPAKPEKLPVLAPPPPPPAKAPAGTFGPK